MKTKIAVLFSLAILMVVALPLSIKSNSETQAEAAAEPVVNCSQVRIGEKQVAITCTAAGIVVLNTVLDLPSVPPVTIPPVTIPGPTSTITVVPQVPPPATVTVPGPTETVTEPGDNVTVEGPAVTVSPSQAPPSPSEAPSSPSGQSTSESVTLEPPNVEQPPPPVDTNTTKFIVRNALAGIALLVLAFFIGLYLGYLLGYRDRQKSEKNFLMALRQSMFGKTIER